MIPGVNQAVHAGHNRPAILLSRRGYPTTEDGSMFGDCIRMAISGDSDAGFAGRILFPSNVLMRSALPSIFGQMGGHQYGAPANFMILGAYVTYLTAETFQSHFPSLSAAISFSR